MNVSAHTLIVIVLSATLGCPARPENTRQRFIEHEPDKTLSWSGLSESTEVFAWRFLAQEGLNTFDIKHEGRPPEVRGQTLIIGPSRKWVSIARTVDFSAADVDVVEIEPTGFPRGRVILYWAGEEEPFSATRSLEFDLPIKRSATGAPWTRVASHSLWSGRIDRLKLDVFSPSREFSLRAVRGLGLPNEPAFTDSLLARAWKASLGNDVRNAVIAMPGQPWEYEAAVPASAQLRFSYGIPEGANSIARFSVSATVGTARSRELFAAEIDPSTEGNQWFSASVDLDAYRGMLVRFAFESELTRHVDPLVDGLPLWANPEIVVLSGARSSPNFILISIDTLRADHLSLYGYSRPTTPGIDAWSVRNATIFENVVAAAPYTVPAHVSMFTGLDASHHRVDYARAIPRSLATLPELLRNKGFATYAVTGGGYVRPHIFGRGFDRFKFWDDVDSSGELMDGLASATSWISEVVEPFFLFFHTYEMHGPHVAREPHYSRLLQRDNRRFGADRLYVTNTSSRAQEDYVPHRHFIADKRDAGLSRPPPLPPELRDLPTYLYDSRLSYADEHVSAFLRELEESGLLKNTVVVITSDHGELLGEHGLAGHLYMYDPNLMIPLIIADPGQLGAGRRISEQVRTVDIAPTVHALVGTEPLPDLDGASLVPLLSGEPAALPRAAWSYAPLANRGISLRLDNGMKFIFSNNPFAPVHEGHEVYDLRSDPEEKSPLDPLSFRHLRDAIANEYEKAARGLRVRFGNTSANTLSGRLKGQGLKLWHLKTTDISCRCLRWAGAGEMLFSIPPNTEYTLFFDGWKVTRLDVSVAVDSGDGPMRFEDSLTREDLAADLSVEWVQDGWQTSAGGGGRDLSGLEIRLLEEDGAVLEASPESGNLTEQLRALGYLN